MLNQGSDASMLLDSIQQHTDDKVRIAVDLVVTLGGKAAVNDFLQHHLSYIAGLAIAEAGLKDACKMMAGSLFAVEDYCEGPEC